MEDNNDEEYKQFLNYELIKVSKDGKVKYNGKILPQTDKDGYCVVEIPNDESQIEYVHKLVAFSWLKDKYIELKKKENGERLAVHHKDYEKLNNHVDNLEWMTDKEHRLLHGFSIDEE